MGGEAYGEVMKLGFSEFLNIVSFSVNRRDTFNLVHQ